MPDDFQKLWLQRNLNALAINRARQEIQRTGRALPCSVTEVGPDGLGNSIVKVKFELVPADQGGGPWTLPEIILPKAESEWLRAPTQVGDFGVTVPADTYLGGISGLGGGQANLTVNYPNLATLVWIPIGSANFGAMPDPNKAWINGPAGAVLSDTSKTATVTASDNLVEVVAQTVDIDATADASIESDGTLEIQSQGAMQITSPDTITLDATGGLSLQGAISGASGAVMRQSDVVTMLNTLATNLQSWAAAHFAGGTSSPPNPTMPTPSGSTKTFSG